MEREHKAGVWHFLRRKALLTTPADAGSAAQGAPGFALQGVPDSFDHAPPQVPPGWDPSALWLPPRTPDAPLADAGAATPSTAMAGRGVLASTHNTIGAAEAMAVPSSSAKKSGGAFARVWSKLKRRLGRSGSSRKAALGGSNGLGSTSSSSRPTVFLGAPSRNAPSREVPAALHTTGSLPAAGSLPPARWESRIPKPPSLPVLLQPPHPSTQQQHHQQQQHFQQPMHQHYQQQQLQQSTHRHYQQQQPQQPPRQSTTRLPGPAGQRYQQAAGSADAGRYVAATPGHSDPRQMGRFEQGVEAGSTARRLVFSPASATQPISIRREHPPQYQQYHEQQSEQRPQQYRQYHGQQPQQPRQQYAQTGRAPSPAVKQQQHMAPVLPPQQLALSSGPMPCGSLPNGTATGGSLLDTWGAVPDSLPAGSLQEQLLGVPARSGLAGQWLREAAPGSGSSSSGRGTAAAAEAGAQVDALLKLPPLQAAARAQMRELQISESRDVLTLEWTTQLSNGSRIRRAEAYPKSGALAAVPRLDGRSAAAASGGASANALVPASAAAQVSFSIDGTLSIKTLQGPPLPALLHQKFRLSSSGSRLRISLKAQLLEDAEWPGSTLGGSGGARRQMAAKQATYWRRVST